MFLWEPSRVSLAISYLSWVREGLRISLTHVLSTSSGLSWDLRWDNVLRLLPVDVIFGHQGPCWLIWFHHTLSVRVYLLILNPRIYISHHRFIWRNVVYGVVHLPSLFDSSTFGVFHIHYLLHCTLPLLSDTNFSSPCFTRCSNNGLVWKLRSIRGWIRRFKAFLSKILSRLLNNSLLTQSTHASTLVCIWSRDSESLLILVIINHLLIRWIISHHLVARSDRVNFSSIIHVVIHIWTRWFKVIIIMIVKCSLSPLLRR